MRRAIGSLLLISASSLCGAQQASAPADTAVTTLSVTTRLVSLDVVVRDSHGQFVRGLTQQDFKVLEDGKLQTIDSFEAHTVDGAESTPAKPAGNMEFTNVAVAGAPAGPITILLFDLLNTPGSDQTYARQQMLKFLRELPSGQRIALFVLTDHLRMVQSFTGSSDLLLSAAKMIDPKDLKILRSQTDQMQDADALQRLSDAMLGRDPGGTIQHMSKDIGLDQAINTDVRARFTIAALAELARATSGYPGRKNLLWMSGSFPLAVGAQMEYNPDAGEAGDSTRDLAHASADLKSMRETANLIASSQIAVYPISLSGTQTDNIGPEAGGKAELGSPIGHQLGVDNQGLFTGRQQTRYAMDDLARQTGGQAFFGTNDMAGALRRGIEDGSNYYSVTYRPQSQNLNGKFRKINVELARGGYTLIYRRGYYATPEKPSADPAQELNEALQPETPDATMLKLRSKVDLPSAQHPGVLVTSYIDASQVDFSMGADGHRRAKLLLLMVAFADGSKQPDRLPQTTGMLNLDLDAERYQTALSSGIGFQQQLALKPGKYRLRLGVSDISNHHLGTLDMPVEITAASANGQ